jgi:hypothetical protein
MSKDLSDEKRFGLYRRGRGSKNTIHDIPVGIDGMIFIERLEHRRR